MKNQKNTLLLFCAILAISLASCGTKPIRLEPLSNSGKTLDSVKAAWSVKNNIEILSSFGSSEGNLLTMNYWVQNHSDSTIIIDPSMFLLDNIDKINTNIHDNELENIKSIHPFTLKEIVNQQLNIESKRFNATAGVNVGIGILSILFNSTTKNKEEREIKNEETSETVSRNLEINSIEHQNNIENIKMQSEYLELSLLKKQELKPDSIAAGIVVFPFYSNYHKYIFTLPIDKTSFKFIFKRIEE